MKLLFIYGSPAVGKLTVAKEIAALTGFRVFHNHLSIDAVLPVFDYGTKPFGKLVNLIRIETIKEAAHENVDLIYTFCYAKDYDDAHVERVIEAVEAAGGTICFVLLKSDRNELNRRVTEESRRKMGKAKTVEMMDYFHATFDLLSPVPGRESLIIDNTQLSAEQAARRIIAHFNLAKIKD
jgi:RNase adaptor protein for sRNA GlmZ degradation